MAVSKLKSQVNLWLACFLQPLVGLFPSVCVGIASLPAARTSRFHQPPDGPDGVSATPPEGG